MIYSAINQYHVVMEIDPRYTQYPNSLNDVYVATSGANAAPAPPTTNAPGGTVTRRPAPFQHQTVSTPASNVSEFAIGRSTTLRRVQQHTRPATASTNALANTGHGPTSAGAAVSTDVRRP